VVKKPQGDINQEIVRFIEDEIRFIRRKLIHAHCHDTIVRLLERIETLTKIKNNFK